MSAIFRCPDGVIRLFCKGADTVILERLSQDEPQPFVDSTLRHLEDFAAEGLRTLCIASRIISDEEYNSWSQTYYEASTSLDNRSDKLDAAAELIEKDLFYLVPQLLKINYKMASRKQFILYNKQESKFGF